MSHIQIRSKPECPFKKGKVYIFLPPLLNKIPTVFKAQLTRKEHVKCQKQPVAVFLYCPLNNTIYISH